MNNIDKQIPSRFPVERKQGSSEGKIDGRKYTIRKTTPDIPIPDRSSPREIQRKPISAKKKELPNIDQELARDEDRESLNFLKPGERTALSEGFFKTMFPRHFKQGVLIHPNGEIYRPLTGAVIDISTQKLCSCGSSTREILTLDPTNTVLTRHCEKIQEALMQMNHPSEADVLDYIKDYINKEIFTASRENLLKKTNAHIKSKSKSHPYIFSSEGIKLSIIPLDEVIPYGVCRHHALATTFILDWLTKQPKEVRQIDGITQHMRFTMENEGAHTWATFMSTSGARFHLDTLWDIALDLNIEENKQKLSMYYGEKIINKEIERSAPAHAWAMNQNDVPPVQKTKKPIKISPKVQVSPKKKPPVKTKPSHSTPMEKTIDAFEKHLVKIIEVEKHLSKIDRETQELNSYAVAALSKNNYVLFFKNGDDLQELNFSILNEGIQSLTNDDPGKPIKSYTTFQTFIQDVVPKSNYEITMEFISKHLIPLRQMKEHFNSHSFAFYKNGLYYYLTFETKNHVIFIVHLNGKIQKISTDGNYDPLGQPFKTIQEFIEKEIE